MGDITKYTMNQLIPLRTIPPECRSLREVYYSLRDDAVYSRMSKKDMTKKASKKAAKSASTYVTGVVCGIPTAVLGSTMVPVGYLSTPVGAWVGIFGFSATLVSSVALWFKLGQGYNRKEYQVLADQYNNTIKFVQDNPEIEAFLVEYHDLRNKEMSGDVSAGEKIDILHARYLKTLLTIDNKPNKELIDRELNKKQYAENLDRRIEAHKMRSIMPSHVVDVSKSPIQDNLPS